MHVNTFEHELVFDPKWKIAVVAARFNPIVTDGLVEGVKNGASELSEDKNWINSNLDIFRVPGSIEIPLVVKKCLETKKYDAIIAIGAVIRGDTAHFDYVCKYVTEGLLKLNLDYSTPIAFGIITTNNQEQAISRSSDNQDNKGRESLLAIVETLNTISKIVN